MLRLSQALYTDIPRRGCDGDCAVTGQQKLSSSLSRKRALASPSSRASGEGTTTRPKQPAFSAVRLLLPRTFATADRTYHAAGRGERVCDDGLETRGEDVELSCPCTSDAPLLPGNDTLGTHNSPHIADGLDVSFETNYNEDDSFHLDNAAARALNAVAGDGSRCGKDCGLTHHWATTARRELPGRFQPVVTTAAPVVVESVLGFSTVSALLEQSYISSTCSAARESDSTSPREGSDHTISEAVRRLIGWINFAAATRVLGQEEEDVAQGHVVVSTGNISTGLFSRGIKGAESSCTISATGQERRHKHHELQADFEEENAVVYEVTGRCDAGVEWDVFYLELADGPENERNETGAAQDQACPVQSNTRRICSSSISIQSGDGLWPNAWLILITKPDFSRGMLSGGPQIAVDAVRRY